MENTTLPAYMDGLYAYATAIQQLPIEFREIIILREYEELSYSEIAKVLQCPMGTVMSRLARARSRLGSLLSVSREPLPAVEERTVEQQYPFGPC